MQVCSDPAPQQCSKVQGKLQSHCSLLLCKTGSQHDCATALTHMEICFSYRCAVTQHHSSAVPTVQCCSAKQAQKQALCHCTYAYGDLLFMQVCSDPTPMHCSKVQGKLQSHCSVLLCKTGSTAGTVSLHLHIWRFALRTGVQ